MRTLAIAAVLACVAFGQKAPDPALSRVFHLRQAQNPQQVQELVNILRALTGGLGAGVPKATVSPGEPSLTLEGNVDQIGLGEWLIGELDQSPAAVAGSAPHEYRLPGGNDVARVFYLQMSTLQSTQEMINLIRSMTEINRIMPNNPLQAIALRGNNDQVQLAEWLVKNLNTLPPASNPGLEYRLAGATPDAVRVFSFPATRSPQQIQQIINTIRANVGVSRLMPYLPRTAVALRGNDDQIAAAEQMIQQLDSGAGKTK